MSISARADGVLLYFNQGHQLPDPKKILRGSGKQTRFVKVEAASQLADPDVEAMMTAAINQATVPLQSKRRGKLCIRGAAAKRKQSK